MNDAERIVENLLESEDPKDFVSQTFEPSPGFSREDQNKAAESAARCVYLWLVQDFMDYENPNDFIDELAYSVADHVTNDLEIGQDSRADAAVAKVALHQVLDGKPLNEIVRVPKEAWEISKEAARAAVDAFVNKSPDKMAYKLRRLRHRRGEM